MRVKFKTSGESSDIGSFTKGEEKDINTKTAQVFIERGLAEECKTKTAKAKEE